MNRYANLQDSLDFIDMRARYHWEEQWRYARAQSAAYLGLTQLLAKRVIRGDLPISLLEPAGKKSLFNPLEA